MSDLPKKVLIEEPEIRVLIALAGLKLETIDIDNSYFSAEEIRVWLINRPEYGACGLRLIQEQLSMMQKTPIKIEDENGKFLDDIKRLVSISKNKGKRYYRISAKTAETPLSAKLILSLFRCQDRYDAIPKADEDRVVESIFDEFKIHSFYKLSDAYKVRRKVENAIDGLYFERDKDCLLRATSRIELELKYLKYLSDLSIGDLSII